MKNKTRYTDMMILLSNTHIYENISTPKIRPNLTDINNSIAETVNAFISPYKENGTNKSFNGFNWIAEISPYPACKIVGIETAEG